MWISESSMTICNYSISFYSYLTSKSAICNSCSVIELPPKTERLSAREKYGNTLSYNTVSALKLDANDAIILD